MAVANGIQLQMRQSYAFMARNFHLMQRYWAWEIVWIAYTIANSLAVTFIAEGSTEIAGTSQEVVSRFTLYLMIGALVWHYLSVIFTFISEVIQWERWEGTIEYTLMAPVNRWVHLIGQTYYAIIYATLHTILIGSVMVFFFKIDLTHANIFGALLILTVGSISLIGIGILGSILPLLYPERGAQMTHIIQASFLLVSGVYYPISVLPEWMQVVARFTPVTYVLDGARATIIDGAGNEALGQYLIPLLIMGAICIPLGIWAFMRAEKYAKATGKLKRVG